MDNLSDSNEDNGNAKNNDADTKNRRSDTKSMIKGTARNIAALEEHILSIVQHRKIVSQRTLQKILQERGAIITQASLSRKLKKLNIAKIAGIYTLMEYRNQYLPTVLDMQISDFGLIVFHTNPGQANSLAYFMDKKYVRLSPDDASPSGGILGTIAGDDTVIAILKNMACLNEVLETLCKDLRVLAIF